MIIKVSQCLLRNKTKSMLSLNFYTWLTLDQWQTLHGLTPAPDRTLSRNEFTVSSEMRWDQHWYITLILMTPPLYQTTCLPFCHTVKSHMPYWFICVLHMYCNMVISVWININMMLGGSRALWLKVHVLPFLSCVTLDKLHNFSDLSLLIFKKG